MRLGDWDKSLIRPYLLLKSFFYIVLNFDDLKFQHKYIIYFIATLELVGGLGIPEHFTFCSTHYNG